MCSLLPPPVVASTFHGAYLILSAKTKKKSYYVFPPRRSACRTTQALFLAICMCVLPLRKAIRTVAPFCKISYEALTRNMRAKVTEEFAATVLGPEHECAKEATCPRYGEPASVGKKTAKELEKEVPGVPGLPFLKAVVKRFLRWAVVPFRV